MTKVYMQNMGKNNFAELGKNWAKILLKDEPEKYTSHCSSRSGAMNLTSSGDTELTLKVAGQWKSITSACEYLDDNTKARTDQLSRLDTGVPEVTPKKTLVEKVTTVPMTEEKVSPKKHYDVDQPSNVSSAVNSVSTINAGAGKIVVNNNFYYSPEMSNQKNDGRTS